MDIAELWRICRRTFGISSLPGHTAAAEHHGVGTSQVDRGTNELKTRLCNLRGGNRQYASIGRCERFKEAMVERLV